MDTVTISSWNEFRNFIDNDRQVYPVYWRGQSDPDWSLSSTFERTILDLAGGYKP
jgi:hypothetical protein